VVTWADLSGNETGFAVERCTGAGCTAFAALGATAVNVTRYLDSGLSPATTYTYRVRARNLAGGSAWSAHASATTSATPAPAPGTLVNRLAGQCLDVEGGANSAANAVLMRCVGSASQTWALPAHGLTGEVRVFDNLCLDVYGGSGNEGDVVGLWPCHGQPNQLWTRNSAGQLVGMNGRCVEPLGGGTASGTPMRFATCRSGAAGQQWTLGISGDQPPVAQLTVGCTGLQCTFGSSGSTDDRGIQSRSWSFGDGTTMGDVVSPLKTYAAAGTYAVQLTVTDAAGQTATAAQNVSVNSTAPNEAPTAAFTAACTGLACAFTDGSSDADGTVSAWQWDFGNQSTSTARNPSVTYALAGTYTVRLTVTDNRGTAASATRLVTVNGIALTATGVKTRNVYRADLRWSGAAGDSVRILRNGSAITTTANDGVHADEQRRAAGTYRYQVCETGSNTRCSAEATVTF
jgi:PKD repeat protein